MSKMLSQLPACITYNIAGDGVFDLSRMGVGIRKAEVLTWCVNRTKEYTVEFTLGIADADGGPPANFLLHSNNGETRPFVIDVTAGNRSLNGLKVALAEGAEGAVVYLTVFIRELGSNPTAFPVEVYGDVE